MSLNLADSAGIMAAYEAVLHNELNWLLLHHSSRIADELALYAFGSEGLEELKAKIDPADPQQTLIGFVRVDSDPDFVPVNHPSNQSEGEEECEVEDGEAKFVIVSYVPKSVLGVRRARAKVHTRRLSMIFKKHDAVLTVDDISQLTNAALAHSLAESDHSTSFSTSVSPIVTSTPAGAGQQHPSPVPSPDLPPTPTQLDTTAGTVLYSASPATVSPIDSPTTPNQDQHTRAPDSHPLIATDMSRSYSQPVATHVGPFAGPTFIDLKPVKRSASESLPSPPPVKGHMKLGSQIGNFLRRKKRSGSAAAAFGRNMTSGAGMAMGEVDESQESADDSMPPPTPPKDKGIYASMAGKRDAEPGHQATPHMQRPIEYLDDSSGARNLPLQPQYKLVPLALPPVLTSISESSFRHNHSVSEFAVISHDEEMGGRLRSGQGEHDVVVIQPEEFEFYSSRHGKPLPMQGLSQHPRYQHWSIDTLKKGKWAAAPEGLSIIRDPAERARLRMELQKQKEEEDKKALRAEEERQQRLKKEKEMALRKEEQEAEYRQMMIREEAQRCAAERRRREELERLEEERRSLEIQERKRMERERRMEEHLKMEEWRREHQRIAEEHAMAEQRAKRREEEERRRKIKKAEGEVKVKAKEGTMTGWVTVQTDENVMWRRRYFKFSPNTIYFYRSAKDLTQVLDRLDVRGTVKGLKEPKDGYEDLEAIPHSFAIEFHDRAPWAMFADSEEDKIKLLSLLQLSAGL